MIPGEFTGQKDESVCRHWRFVDTFYYWVAARRRIEMLPRAIFIKSSSPSEMDIWVLVQRA